MTAMSITLPILILAIPLTMFLLLGICGFKMSHKLAGWLGCLGMGTTLVAAVVNGTDTAVVNVGDSRCYWLAEGQLLQVTRDHSWVQELVDQGEISADEARSHPRRNLITRALGLQRRSRSDIYRLDFQENDSLLLCSDGLSNLVTEQEMTSVLAEEEDIQASCGRLLELALQRGAPDNVTVLILRR